MGIKYIYYYQILHIFTLSWNSLSHFFWKHTGDMWQKFRDGSAPDPSTYVRRSKELCTLVRQLMSPKVRHRPMAEDILALPQVQSASNDTFIVDVIRQSRQDGSKRRRTSN